MGLPLALAFVTPPQLAHPVFEVERIDDAPQLAHGLGRINEAIRGDLKLSLRNGYFFGLGVTGGGTQQEQPQKNKLAFHKYATLDWSRCRGNSYTYP
jgi:hypothetical protein